MYSALRKAWLRIRFLLGRRQFDEDLTEEIRFHVESRARDLEQSGVPAPQAYQAAARRFGNRTQAQDASRRVWLAHEVEEFFRDLRIGSRHLLRSPAFTLAMVGVLALGVGANVAVFDVVHAVLLRPLPHPDAHRLVALFERNTETGQKHLVSPADFFDYEQRSNSFARLAAYYPPGFTLTGQEEAERVQGARVTSGMFDVFGVEPVLGRGFTSEEDRRGASPVAVIGHALWQRRFAGDRGVLGRTILLSGNPYTVIGVLPENFESPVFWPSMPEVWVPLGLDPNVHSRKARFLRVFGRLHPGSSVERAGQEFTALARTLAREHPETNATVGTILTPLQEHLTGQVRPSLIALLAAVGVLLLAAVANAAGLMLARVSGRTHEFAVRRAIGAGRLRVVRQLLTEIVWLGVLSAAAALFVIWLSNDLLVAAAKAAGLPRAAEIGMRVPVVAFACGAALLAAILSVLVPAFQAARGIGNLGIGERTRSATAGRNRHWFRAGLLATEAALSLMLLSAAGLLARSFLQLQSTDPGFDARGVYTARLSVPSARYPAGPVMASFRERMLDRLRAAPGVQSAAVVDWLPLSGMGAGVGFRPIESAVVGKVSPSAELRVISPDYFRTLRVPLLSGRMFDARDSSRASNVVIVNQSLVRRYFGKRVPLGQRLIIDSRQAVTCTIVGVVGDMHQYNLREAPSPEIFAPFTQQPWILHDTRDFVIRSALDPTAVTALLRQLIRQMEPEIPFKTALPMDEVIGETLVRPRFYSAALGIFAGAALLLAAFGIYGAVAGAVAERTREIGIRTALGARSGNVVRFVASQGALPAFVGLAAGLPLTLVSGRVVAGYFEGVSSPDWTGIVLVAALQLGVALLAAALPARRAARLDPASALRQD